MLQCSRERRATRDSTRDGGINSVMEGGGSSATFTGKTHKCEAEAADLSEGVRSSKMIAGPPRKSFKRLPQWGRRYCHSSSGTSDRSVPTDLAPCIPQHDLPTPLCPIRHVFSHSSSNLPVKVAAPDQWRTSRQLPASLQGYLDHKKSSERKEAVIQITPSPGRGQPRSCGTSNF